MQPDIPEGGTMALLMKQPSTCGYHIVLGKAASCVSSV